MNNLLSNVMKPYTSVLETISLTCRNYSYHLSQGDYVRHLPYTQTLVRPYAVILKDTRLPGVFLGVWEYYFSSEVLL